METLWQDLKYAVRMLAKKPAFTGIAVLTLALGIGANTAIFSVVNTVLLRALPFPHPDRLVMLWEKDKDGSSDNTSFATYVDWRNESHSLEHIAVISYWFPTIIGQDHAEKLEGLRVSTSFFSVLGVKPALGRDFLTEEDQRGNHHVVILSHGLWARKFGSDPGIAGKPITMDGIVYVVVGVMPAGFESLFSSNRERPAEIWAPLAYNATLPWACRTCRHLRAVARLDAGVPLEQARAEMNTLSHNLFLQYPHDYSAEGVVITPLHEQLVGDVRPALIALLGAVGFVLLIACGNVANLLLGLAAQRRREVAIRAALGGSRARLIRQLLTESVLLALLGGAAGLLLAVWGVDFLVSLAPSNLPRLDQIHLDGQVLAYTLGLCLLTGVIFGMAPALQIFRLDPNESLKEGGRQMGASERRPLRSALVVSGVALALMLLIGSGLMLRSVSRLLAVNPGFDTSHLLTMEVDFSGASYREDVPCAEGPCLTVKNFYQQALERIRALPGVDSAGVVSQLPLGGNFDRYGMHIEGKLSPNPEDDPSADRYGISLGYLHAMRIPVLRGREFTAEDRADTTPVVLISETFTRRVWPNEDPLGKRIQMGGFGPTGGPWRSIAGVVGDVRHQGLDAPSTMQIYLPQSQWLDSSTILAVRAKGDPGSLAGAVRNAVWSVDKNQPISNVATMDRVIATSMAQRRFAMTLFSIFAGLALVLAAVGLYGVLAHSVSTRTNEIGVRIALGAQGSDILRLVVNQGLFLTALGIAIGLAGAAGLTRFLQSQLFGVAPTDPVTFAAVPALLAAVALLACYVPARRATRVDPMVALRYE